MHSIHIHVHGDMVFAKGDYCVLLLCPRIGSVVTHVYVHGILCVYPYIRICPYVYVYYIAASKLKAVPVVRVIRQIQAV